MRSEVSPRGAAAPVTARSAGIALAILAAIITAACAAHSGLGLNVIVWRAAVSAFSVWSFQFSASTMWAITDPIAPHGSETARPAARGIRPRT